MPCTLLVYRQVLGIDIKAAPFMSDLTLKIVTRKSPLAMWQAKYVMHSLQNIHPDLHIEICGMKTLADQFLNRPIGSMGGKGLFVKELEQALLDGDADIAVHSMKDVTVDMPAGLSLPVIMQREDPRDVFIANGLLSPDEPPPGLKVGTSSLRRQCQLHAAYPGLRLSDIRGNVGTRLKQLDDGEYDALILAAAGMKRLGLAGRIKRYMDVKCMLPAVGQGAMGIQTRAADERILTLIRPLDHKDTHLCVRAERALSRKLHGDCHLPIAAYAVITAGTLSLSAMVGRPDGSRIEKADIKGDMCDPESLADQLGDTLLAQGADHILQEVLANEDT